MTDQPDTLAMLRTAMGGDVLCNHTTGRYLSDHIEELIAARVKMERSECAKVCEDMAGTMSMFANVKDAKMHNNAVAGCAAAIRARSQP